MLPEETVKSIQEQFNHLEFSVEDVKKCPELIRHIDDPSEDVQLAAVQQNPLIIQYIQNTSEDVQYNAVMGDPNSIKYIVNPSEDVQLAAVEENGFVIMYFKNPSENVQLAAVKDEPNAIKYIDNPSEKVKLAASGNTQDDDLGNVSDGYHTFNELYEFRKLYNAALFNEWGTTQKYQVHKSIKHYDGEECFGGGWFIVVAMLPDGMISNHYEMKDWDLFKIPEYDKAIFPFDGHTSEDVLNRLKGVL